MLAKAIALAALVLAGSAASATGATTVPVIHCPTTYGISQPPPHLPGRLPVSAGASAAAGLDAYSDGALFLLAPAGMHCHALIATDGGASIVITAGSTTHVREPAVTAYFADTPGTAGSLACPLFASAAAQLSRQPCPRSKPAAESTYSAGQGALYFTDPPHVHGDGAPSGGADPAHGAIAFAAASRGLNGYAFIATCTLPAREHGRCATILRDALTRIPANV